jgi:hypothetical protein
VSAEAPLGADFDLIDCTSRTGFVPSTPSSFFHRQWARFVGNQQVLVEPESKLRHVRDMAILNPLVAGSSPARPTSEAIFPVHRPLFWLAH